MEIVDPKGKPLKPNPQNTPAIISQHGLAMITNAIKQNAQAINQLRDQVIDLEEYNQRLNNKLEMIFKRLKKLENGNT